MKITYLKIENEYLIIKEDGTSEMLKSEESFNNYLTENKCEVIK